MNVLLFTVDCLRHDKVGCVAGQGNLTPNIDRFSREATVFDQAISQGTNTWVSFASILTSSYPYFPHKTKRPVLSGTPSLASILSKEGFATGGFHSNPWLSRHFGYGQEYDVYEDNLLPPLIRSRSRLVLRLSRVRHGLAPYLPADKVTAQALAWIKQQHGPFFAWIHTMDAHGPYRTNWQLPAWMGHLWGWRLYRKAQRRPAAISAAERRTLLRRYEGGVHFVDRAWAAMQRELESSGQWDNTLVIFTGDHGEAFGEHGRYTHGGLNFFDEVLRVPLIVRWPDRKTVPRVSGQVELTTIVPTVLDLLGVALPAHVEGRSAVPWLRGRVAASEPINAEAISNGAIYERYATVSVRTPEWKYILRRSEYDGTEDGRLYHLATDPGAHDERGQQHPAVADKMKARAMAHIEHVLSRATPEPEDEDVPQEVTARLKALGYMD